MRGYFNETKIEHGVLKGETVTMEQEVLNRAGNGGKAEEGERGRVR